ncbi:MAG TPA: outer membrane protein transport protein [Polyangiaceae bacterium]|nr:outer membrane protein transport protein [Polyangiaceae bacterium]
MRKLAISLTLLACGTLSSEALASGYFNGAKGARAAGRAGAFTARADDLSAVSFNPAGLSHLESTLIQVGNRFSYNAHSYQRAPTLDWGDTDNGIPRYVEFAEVENGAPWQLLDPILGVASKLGLRDWTFALAAFSPAGVAREEYPIGGGQRYMMVEREAIILNYSATAAWQFRKTFGLGASLQWIAVPKLEYALVIDGSPYPKTGNPVASELDMLATTEGADYFTLNAVLGAWYRPAPFLELGISGQVVPTQMTTDSTLSVKAVNSGLVGDVELLREGKPADDVRITFPMPLTFRGGVRYRHLEADRELFDLELDATYETWSHVERFVVESDGLIANYQEQLIPIGRIEIEKQWRDTLTLAVGGDYAVIPDRLTVRGGAYYETAVAEDAYANVDFAGGPFLGFALGASLYFGSFEVAAAYEYRHQPALSVAEGDARVYQEVPGSPCVAPYTGPECHDAYQGLPAPAVNAGTYRARHHVASLDVLYRF